jgi:hypothetical protein
MQCIWSYWKYQDFYLFDLLCIKNPFVIFGHWVFYFAFACNLLGSAAAGRQRREWERVSPPLARNFPRSLAFQCSFLWPCHAHDAHIVVCVFAQFSVNYWLITLMRVLWKVRTDENWQVTCEKSEPELEVSNVYRASEFINKNAN